MEADNTFHTDQICSFTPFYSHVCGPSKFFPSECNLVPISKCLKNISSHLNHFNLSNSHIPTEGHLLCFRVGIFSCKSMVHCTICPKLRAQLGVMWRRGSTCAYPNHTGKAKPERSISPSTSYFLLANKGVLVPVGSGKYYLKSYFEMFGDTIYNVKISLHLDLYLKLVIQFKGKP